MILFYRLVRLKVIASSNKCAKVIMYLNDLVCNIKIRKLELKKSSMIRPRTMGMQSIVGNLLLHLKYHGIRI